MLLLDFEVAIEEADAVAVGVVGSGKRPDVNGSNKLLKLFSRLSKNPAMIHQSSQIDNSPIPKSRKQKCLERKQSAS